MEGVAPEEKAIKLEVVLEDLEKSKTFGSSKKENQELSSNYFKETVGTISFMANSKSD